MTSTASQPTTNPAPIPPAASSAPSYASAAGAKASTPLIVQSTSQPPSGGPAGSTAQHGKSSSTVNGGRPPITPAVPTVSAAPAVAHGTSTVMNGSSADHSRKASVSIPASANSYNANGNTNGGAVGKVKPQFGFDSPAMSHSTLQGPSSGAIPIPGARIASPASSPSPIPQQSSGGKPGATAGTGFQIGSYNNEAESSSMPQAPIASGSHQPSQHLRRDSAQSQHSDMSYGQGQGRGFNPSHRGRGNFAPYNPQPHGYPPNGSQYRGPPHGQGRGGMQSQNSFRGNYPNSPQPARGSPALPPAMLNQSTPTMGNAVPNLANPYNNYQIYPPPMSAPMGSYQPVNFPHSQNPPFIVKSSNKKKTPQWDPEKSSHLRQRNYFSGRPRGLSKRRGSVEDSRYFDDLPLRAHPAPIFSAGTGSRIDLSPGNFEKLLTGPNAQGYIYDQRGVMTSMGSMGNMGNISTAQYGQPPMHMYQSPASPAPGGYQQPFNGHYAAPQPQTQPMSRTTSQISERPASSTGLKQPLVVSSTPQTKVSSPHWAKVPRKSASVITIKNAAGEAVDFASMNVRKTPASPAPPSIQQSKTPPVIASTPTPPPKVATPASHARSESNATAADKEKIQKDFMERVKQSKEGEATKSEDKIAHDEKVKGDEEQRIKEEDRVKADAKAAEDVKVAADAKADQDAKDAKSAEDEKAAEDAKAEAETKAEAEAKAKTDADEVAAAAKQVKSVESESPKETQDEYMDRMIREMEEEDARREAKQAEITAKKDAEKAAAKKKADEEKASSNSDEKLREQEREMERLEEEREKARAAKSVSEQLTDKISDLTASEKKDTASATPNSIADRLSSLTINSKVAPLPGSAPSSAKSTAEKKGKPAALTLNTLNTKAVEAPQPSAALQSLKSARFLTIKDEIKYPSGIASPNPAINAAVAKKGKVFKYDSAFLMQFKGVFTEQPSLEFSQQLKSILGDTDGSRSASTRTPAGSGRQNSRNATGGFPGAMGTFTAQSSGKPLPSGTTSEQRFAMSQGQMSRPANPMASFTRPGGAFPGGSNAMSRTPSSSNMGMPNSPRQGSRSQRGGGNSSRRGYQDQSDAKNAKTMPLTQGMDLKPIIVSASGWKPTSLAGKATAQGPVVSAAAAPAHLEPEIVQRKVKAALNKMTPEKFDKISDQILAIAGQSKDEQDGRTLRQVIQLTFEKATDEAHWASMYAKFCKRMLETMSTDIKDATITDKNGNLVSGGALFRKYLLNRCQEEFERGWKVDLPNVEGEEGSEKKEAALLSDEYYVAAAAKRRGLGLVQFIGELFKLGMLTERIMHECVRKLLDFQGQPDEAEIESLSKLLRTVGGSLDNTEKGKTYMDAYFVRIQGVADQPDLPSRLRFMLMDVVDLRKVGWRSKDGGIKGPKTLDEIRIEAETAAAQKAAESARSNTRQGGGGGGGRMGGRGDSRNFSGYNQPVPNQVGMDDLRRLKGGSNRTMSGNVSLGPGGPSSLFNTGRSSSGRARLGPGGSLTRGGEDSGASSRTGTPPTRESANAFAALANMDTEHPASPPSTAASPALAKAKPETLTGDEKKQ